MSEVDAIFDAIGKFSALVHLADERRKKLEQIASVNAKRCGNCNHWMKSSCAPEKQHKQFKSCNSFACKDFVLDDKGLTDKFKQELTVIDSRIAKATGGQTP